jgi:hypothetical protein
VATRPNYDYLRLKLREIDDDVSAGGPAERCGRRSWRPSAARPRARSSGTAGAVDDAALEDARARYTLQRARGADSTFPGSV